MRDITGFINGYCEIILIINEREMDRDANYGIEMSKSGQYRN